MPPSTTIASSSTDSTKSKLSGVTIVCFALIHLAPGDPAAVIAGPDAPAEDVARIRGQLGLDRPLLIQLVHWYGHLLRGDLGQSIFLRKPVVHAILDRVEPTLLLTLGSTLIAIAIGVPAGVLSARYHNTLTDQAFMVLALDRAKTKGAVGRAAYRAEFSA